MAEQLNFIENKGRNKNLPSSSSFVALLPILVWADRHANANSNTTHVYLKGILPEIKLNKKTTGL